MPEKSLPVGRRKRRWWRVLLAVIAMLALLMLVMNPELAALGFLFDPIVLDVALVFLGAQLLQFNGQIRSFFAATGSSALRRWNAFRLRR